VTRIHPTALVDSAAELDSSVSVGPFSVIGPHVKIGPGTEIGAHCVIEGHTSIGANNRFVSYCSIGAMPQDKKYRNEPTRLEIGDNNVVREFCTMHVGTVQDEGVTRVGNDNWIMTYVHIAHDCRIGNNTILSASAQLAGHVHVNDWAILGGFTGVHQFVKIGAHVMTGAQTLLLQDVPPFVLAAGSPAKPAGINVEGLKRRGFSAESIKALRDAYKVLYRSGLTLAEARAAIEARRAQDDAAAPLSVMLAFLDTASRGIIR
jgi:UDP-N-acetylglucosamine acyltransferase